MKLGIYMGSFNPPHQGHIDIVKYLLKNNYVDKVLIVPTLNYWNKQDLVDIQHRINMLKFFENDRIQIDSEHNQYIYTYELLKKIEKSYPCDELFLIIGADNLVEFHKWKKYKELLKKNIIVVNRDNIDISFYLEKLGANNFIVVNNYQGIPISSSTIRKNLDSKYLDKRVLNYIQKNHLYFQEDNNEK